MNVKRWLLAAAFLGWIGQASGQMNGSLFSDHKARSVGDVITVLVMEYASASSAASTTTQKENDLGLMANGGMRTQAYTPYFGASGNLNRDFDADATVSRQGKLRTKITANIVEVRPNGYFAIQASRMVEVNGEKEFTTITGVVRPQDIAWDNTVLSTQIADAQITYKGKGVVHNGQKPGLLGKVANWIF